jgi:hypothetical protein
VGFSCLFDNYRPSTKLSLSGAQTASNSRTTLILPRRDSQLCQAILEKITRAYGEIASSEDER